MTRWLACLCCLLLLTGCTARDLPSEDTVTVSDPAVFTGDMTVTAVSPSGLTLHITADDAERHTGQSYTVEVQTDGGWQPLPMLTEAIFTTEAILLFPQQTYTDTVNWEWLYGTLPQGHYRIGKPITAYRAPGDYDTVWYYAAFDIAATAQTVGDVSDAVTVWVNYADRDTLFDAAQNPSALSVPAHCPVFRFDTLDDLTAFKARFDDMLSFSEGYNEVPSFDSATARMDTAWFDSFTLLAVYVEASSGSYRFGFDSLEQHDNTLTVHVTQQNDPEIGTCDMAGWLILLPLEKATLPASLTLDAALHPYA